MSELKMTRLRYMVSIVAMFICGWAANELSRNYSWHGRLSAIVMGVVVPLLFAVVAVVWINLLERRCTKAP